LQLSYPSCREGVWNTLEAVTDLKKYGAQMPSEKMAAATLQGSLSCRAILGLIITKSVYLLKDTEKIGLYVQLIKEAWNSMT
jgi:L-lactate permease